MQATIIYNKNAFDSKVIEPEAIKEALLGAGYYPVYKATSCEEDLDGMFDDIEGLIVVAGGDGTLRAVARRIIGKDVFLSLLPIGAANNIAKTFGLEGKPLEIVAGLGEPAKVQFDVGRVRAPWGEDYFLEGLGWGFYADTLAEYDPEQGKSIWRSLKSTIKTLTGYEAHSCRMTLDGRDVSGDYLLVEVHNTMSVGPHLRLAPEARPNDGLFDVICIAEDDRDTFFSYLTRMVTEELAELPSVTVRRGRKLDLEWPGFTIHVDAEIRPHFKRYLSQQAATSPENPEGRIETVTIEIIPQALEFWLPDYPKEKHNE